MRDDPQRDMREHSEDLVVVRVPPPVSFVQIEESIEDIEASSADFALLFWILGLIFFGLGDTISSFLVFAKGGVEANPFMAWTLTLPGGLMAFVFVKILAMSVLYIVSYLWHGVHQWMIPLLMTIVGVYLTTNNTLQYLGMQ